MFTLEMWRLTLEVSWRCGGYHGVVKTHPGVEITHWNGDLP
jgi:hypothetical protein